MNKRMHLTAGALALVLSLWSPAPGVADVACSNATLSGNYGFLLSGVNFTREMPREYAFVGRFGSDGAGIITGGKGTQSVKGAISRAEFSGKYEVAADCSGVATLSFGRVVDVTLHFVVMAGGSELHFIVADPGVHEIGSAKRIAAAEIAGEAK